MAKERKPQPSGQVPSVPVDTTGEPGRKYDHLSTAGEGPGQTPLEDVIPGILITVVAIIVIPLVIFVPGVVVAVTAVFVPVGVVFLALGIWLIRRGSKRWAWRKANVHLTGGRYLRPWEKTPDSY